ncbi:Hypothetical protein HDN1F_37480 [gamma proteobacterium HdN1]|nr:Hypothetical protein HDN1F_37480 [gamma proteobacterium HdN1]
MTPATPPATPAKPPIQHPADFPLFRQEGSFLLPTSLTAGPWYPNTQHGSAMLAMVALAVEQWEFAERLSPNQKPNPRQVVRMTVDMMRAAPVQPVEVVTRIIKEGRSVELLEIDMQADGERCIRASVLRFRCEDLPVDASWHGCAAGQAPKLPPPLGFDPFVHARARDGLHLAIELRVDIEASPAILWMRLRQPVVEGRATSPLARVALAADWTYSVPVLTHHLKTGTHFGKDAFFAINPDTTINLIRPAEGEWIGLQSLSALDDLGAGLASARIFDERGLVGRCTQSILVRGVPPVL